MLRTCSFRLFAMGMGALLAGTAGAAPPDDLDARVEAAMKAHGVPGMAVSIVEGGENVVARGYGVRRLGGNQPVDPDTLFVIGSTTKAFTAAALALLVDEGRIGWDDKVIDHLPGFQMYDPWVTREITVRDLLVHRSGLGLGAGDLMFVPRTSRSRRDIVDALRHIKPASSFRSGYAYDNVLYVVAGQLIEAVSGQSWEAFVREHVLRPAGMDASTTDVADLLANPDRAQPHARIDGRIRGIGKQEMLDETAGLPQVIAPAGLLASNARDMGRWLAIQLGHGALPGGGEGGTRLFSEDASREMWTPQVHVPIQQAPAPIAETTPQFSSYALGWGVQDYRGVKIIEHGGAVLGMQSMVVLVPSLDVGFALHINSEDGVVLKGLMYELLDHYMGLPGRDWVGDFAAFKQARVDAALGALDAIAAQDKAKGAGTGKPAAPLPVYAGRYADPWYGPIAVELADGRLRMDFEQTPGMRGTLTHARYDTFRVDWDDASIEPAYATFALDAKGEVERITMQAVSPLADFSFDYQDLLFTPE
ncbi:serine hydrolase [Marilutibacter spongiae]|nr:serine hydrolase [Lysobacter spongiae]